MKQQSHFYLLHVVEVKKAEGIKGDVSFCSNQFKYRKLHEAKE
jgi:hypothetical protein